MTSDIIELAQDYSFEIEMMEDPVEASIHSALALRTLEKSSDERLKPGTLVIIQAMSALMINHYVESRDEHLSLQLDEIVGTGESAGISFIQNIGKPRIQSLFLVLRNSDIFESSTSASEPVRYTSPRIAVPVLSIKEFKVAA